MKILNRWTDKSFCLQDSHQSKETAWRKWKKSLWPQRQQQLVLALPTYRRQLLYPQRHRQETEIWNQKVILRYKAKGIQFHAQVNEYNLGWKELVLGNLLVGSRQERRTMYTYKWTADWKGGAWNTLPQSTYTLFGVFGDNTLGYFRSCVAMSKMSTRIIDQNTE